MDRKILTYDSVEISFGGKAVVHDVSFSLEHGEILGLVGESGSGKSTLIKAAMGLLGPDGLVTRGDIRYMNQNILDIPEKEKRKIRGAGIGMQVLPCARSAPLENRFMKVCVYIRR